MKFYTIKLPKFLGGIVKAMLNTFSKKLEGCIQPNRAGSSIRRFYIRRRSRGTSQ